MPDPPIIDDDTLRELQAALIFTDAREEALALPLMYMPAVEMAADDCLIRFGHHQPVLDLTLLAECMLDSEIMAAPRFGTPRAVLVVRATKQPDSASYQRIMTSRLTLVAPAGGLYLFDRLVPASEAGEYISITVLPRR